MAAANNITLKLFIDKEKSRVVFAESSKDFVDILFSFLTLPLGTIVRLLGNKSNLGCLDNLYDSVSNLDPKQHLQTKACNSMLLRPLSSAAVRCNIDNTTNPRMFYVCGKPNCSTKAIYFTSSVQNAPCGHCGETMGSANTWREGVLRREVGGFVKQGLGFIISDDLHVTIASTTHLALRVRVGSSAFEERTLVLGSQEVLNLLRLALVSEMPLTRLCFPQLGVIDAAETFHTTKELAQPVTERDTATGMHFRKVSIKLLIDEANNNNKVVYAEAGEELMDLLFSFLTFPLGSVIKLLNKNSRIGCMDNLYKSIESLNNNHMESDECMNMLLSPKLAPFFGCSNQLLKVDEASPREALVPGCQKCFGENKIFPIYFFRNDSSRQEMGIRIGSSNPNNYTYVQFEKKCGHGLEYSAYRELNPKMSDGATETGGGYFKGPGRFIITDDLCISPFSQITLVQTINKSSGPFNRLVEKEYNIGETQALHLLRAALTSQAALSDALFY